MQTKVAILGLGWLGLPLAHYFTDRGHKVSGSTACLQELEKVSVHAFPVSRIRVDANGSIGDWEAFLFEANVCVITIPVYSISNSFEHYKSQIEVVLAKMPETIKVVFVSSISVYANNGSVVKEEGPFVQENERGKAILAVEQMLQEQLQSRVTIVRMAGLIGPDRHPAKYLMAKRVLKSADQPLNIVHQKDAIALIYSIVKQDCFGEVVNACCDVHSSRKEWYEKASKQWSLPEPKYKSSRKGANKLVDNQKSKALLQFNYAYTTPEAILQKQPHQEVLIVGAGPGDPKLLTVLAKEAIEHADVVLYDNLVSNCILSLSKRAKKIYVGKKYGCGSNQQERQLKINEALRMHYLQGQKVVRLKSGDPYVFGRAAEEVRFLNAFGIPHKVIPGISAALAAAAGCNIPITERKQSSAMLLCTAHASKPVLPQLEPVIALLNQGHAVGLYMGLKNRKAILDVLNAYCKSPEKITVHAISNVSRPEEKHLVGGLLEIESMLEKSSLEMPVVFVLGPKHIEKK